MDYGLKDPRNLGWVQAPSVPNGPSASPHCLNGFFSFNLNMFGPGEFLVDVDTQIFYILFQLDRFIKDGKADCLIFPLMRYKEGLSFIEVNTESFFMAPLLDFREGILGSFKSCIDMCSVPSIVMTVPPAYPRHQIW